MELFSAIGEDPLTKVSISDYEIVAPGIVYPEPNALPLAVFIAKKVLIGGEEKPEVSY